MRGYCKACKVVTFEGNPNHDGHRLVKLPSERTLERYVFDGVAKTPDGCRVEPDGHCGHGHGSWLIVLGLI